MTRRHARTVRFRTVCRASAALLACCFATGGAQELPVDSAKAAVIATLHAGSTVRLATADTQVSGVLLRITAYEIVIDRKKVQAAVPIHLVTTVWEADGTTMATPNWRQRYPGKPDSARVSRK